MSTLSLEHQIHELLGDGQISFAAAESCTGGLIGYRVTSVSGSSAYFLGSVVAYANDLKSSLLGVRGETLETRGAVSQECAREMAEGIRERTGATITVSTTGIAGPTGATARKPVGLIYVACASPLGTEVYEKHWHGDRLSNMRDATEFALELVIDAATRIRGEARKQA